MMTELISLEQESVLHRDECATPYPQAVVKPMYQKSNI
jgi:hypothetical protein